MGVRIIYKRNVRQIFARLIPVLIKKSPILVNRILNLYVSYKDDTFISKGLTVTLFI